VSDGGVPVVKLVCEGDTDIPILSSIIESMADEDLLFDCIQPERPLGRPDLYGELGSGWEGVRRWCERQCQRFGSLAAAMAQPPLSDATVLVIHVDADIATHPNVDCERECPPASDTADALRDVVVGWGAEETVPERVVLCVPSKATDAWVLVALYPDDRLARPDIECRPKPETLLKQRSEKLVSGSRKHPEAYKAVAPRVAQAWGRVTSICTQAARFETEIAEALG